jgi:hypothetical protein
LKKADEGKEKHEVKPEDAKDSEAKMGDKRKSPPTKANRETKKRAKMDEPAEKSVGRPEKTDRPKDKNETPTSKGNRNARSEK